MAWHLGNEPKKWIYDKNKPELVRDYTAIVDNTSITGLRQQYAKQDQAKEEQRLDKLKRSEMNSFNAGVMPYGLDNPVAPITSQTQMPMTTADMIPQAITPVLGWAVAKGSQKYIKDVFKKEIKDGWEIIDTFDNSLYKNDALTVYNKFEEGIKQQGKWNLHPETLARKEDTYLGNTEMIAKVTDRTTDPSTKYLLDRKLRNLEPISTVSTFNPIDNRFAEYNPMNNRMSVSLKAGYFANSEDITRWGRHEKSHFSNLGGRLYNDKTLSKFKTETKSFNDSDFGKNLNILSKENIDKNWAVYHYYSDPTEIHARLDELRGELQKIEKGFQPGTIVTPDNIKSLENTKVYSTLRDLRSVLKDDNSIVRLMNYLPALGAGITINRLKPEEKKMNWK